MRAKAAGYTKAPRNDIDDYLPLTPTRIKSELEPMDRFKRYEEVNNLFFFLLILYFILIYFDLFSFLIFSYFLK